MNFFNCRSDVRCEKCDKHPQFIIWDHDFDYDGNDRIHEYGNYRCQCGDSRNFKTNDPYEDEDQDEDED